LTATTGTAPDPPFLPPFGSAVDEVEAVEPTFGPRYQAPAPNIARTGSHSQRRPEGRRFGGFVAGDAGGIPCSIAGKVCSFMRPLAVLRVAMSSKAPAASEVHNPSSYL